MKKILLSGVQPTGRPHIGNYFGAMKQFVDLQNSGEYQCYFMIADYHALNFVQNAKELSENILGVALDYLAIGLDPERSLIFKQSDVSEHTELAWIFDTITTMPYLMRSHAFKDAETKNKEICVGTFNYPMLMAADILLYDTDIVPVGQDQKQHIEYTRDTAQKFNTIFGNTFKLPESFILKEVAVIPGTDSKKMSKSHKNTIPLFASDEEIEKSVMSIVTDSSSGLPENVYNIHKLFRSESELKNIYTDKKGKYKELKDLLISDIKMFIAPLRENRNRFIDDTNAVRSIINKGGEKAKQIAFAKMQTVRRNIGVL